MNNSDEAVEKVLAGLRNADPDAGMERRILAALDAHAAERSRSAWLRLWQLRPVAATSVACAIAAVGVLFLIATTHRSVHQAARVGTVGLMANSQADKSNPGAEAQTPAGELPPRQRNAKDTRRSAAHTAEVVLAGGSAVLHREDSVSFPTPPLPLTEQERLLLQLVHHRRPQLPLLDSAAQDAKETEQFQEFFKPEPSLVVNEVSVPPNESPSR